MHFSVVRSLWLTAAAFVAGAINAIAGGGSLLSFPALLHVGVLPVQANATNTVALLPGQFTSAAAYRRELRHHHSMLLPLLLAAFAGGLIGARLLIATPQGQFLRLVPWLLLLATVLFSVGPPLQKRFLQTAQVHPQPHGLRPMARILLPFGVFLVCLYIGYFGAGAGLLIMGTLSFAGVESVHEINALKSVITSVSNSVAAITFVIFGAVLWRYGLTMMLAASIGGYLSAHTARKRQPKRLRIFIILMGCTVTTYFFWKIY
ncbi:MAG TPA: sulfite exporter TauE/SafE family protein [Acidobacteriaceae bacterium]|jgi:hypothetical protein|nr:sulfite exporter TauE/SafE family protein [Acidobacteriaceae bacterium]